MNVGGGVFAWLAHYGGWGAVMILSGFFIWLLGTGKIVTKNLLDRTFDTNEKLSETVEQYSQAWPKILSYMESANHFFNDLQSERDREDK